MDNELYASIFLVLLVEKLSWNLRDGDIAGLLMRLLPSTYTRTCPSSRRTESYRRWREQYTLIPDDRVAGEFILGKVVNSRGTDLVFDADLKIGGPSNLSGIFNRFL